MEIAEPLIQRLRIKVLYRLTLGATSFDPVRIYHYRSSDITTGQILVSAPMEGRRCYSCGRGSPHRHAANPRRGGNKYYYHNMVILHVDNIIKPIQDALIGVVYIDDSQLIHAQSSRTRIDGSFTRSSASAVLLTAFSKRDAFVYITVTEPPDLSKL